MFKTDAEPMQLLVIYKNHYRNLKYTLNRYTNTQILSIYTQYIQLLSYNFFFFFFLTGLDLPKTGERILYNMYIFSIFNYLPEVHVISLPPLMGAPMYSYQHQGK